MGYALSLLALKCPDPHAALSDLKIERTGGFCQYPDAPLSGYALPGGWYLVAGNHTAHRLLEPKVLELISRKYAVVACSIEEHVMFSSAEQWVGGAVIWRAVHDGVNDSRNLETSGTLPPSFQSIADARMAALEADGGDEAEVDHYFEIPLETARSIIGFKHDEEIPGLDYSRFDLLKDLDPPQRVNRRWKFWK
jgi:hypothetical protein